MCCCDLPIDCPQHLSPIAELSQLVHRPFEEIGVKEITMHITILSAKADREVGEEGGSLLTGSPALIFLTYQDSQQLTENSLRPRLSSLELNRTHRNAIELTQNSQELTENSSKLTATWLELIRTQ